MNKKKLFKEIIGFIIFISIIGGIFSKVTWVFRGNGIEAREDVMGLDNEKCEIDVMLFDASDVLRFYDPHEAWDKYGFTAYNYATSSAQTDMLRFYAEESRKTHEAKLYVFDLRSITYVSEEITELALRNWSDSLPVFSKIRAEGIYSYLFNRDWTGSDIPSYFFDIIKYHTNYDSLSSEAQWTYGNKNKIYNIDKGFEPYTNHTPFSKPVVTEERGKISEKQLKALKELIEYCNSEKINALFICSPVLLSEVDQKLMNSVSDYIEDTGYEFIDFNKHYDEMGIDFEADYADVNHVNYFGAKKFTEYFTDLLVEKYDFEDHRGESEFSSWHDDYTIMIERREGWMLAAQNELNSHLDAKELGERLSNIDDFSTWYDYIQNINYTTIVKISDVSDVILSNSSINRMFADYGIDTSKDSYIGIWNGTDALDSSSDTLSLEANIGIDGGRGTDKCILSLEDNEMSIGNINYFDEGSKIQMIVYDNNYKKIIDNVSIEMDYQSDSVKIVRQ